MKPLAWTLILAILLGSSGCRSIISVLGERTFGKNWHKGTCREKGISDYERQARCDQERINETLREFNRSPKKPARGFADDVSDTMNAIEAMNGY